MRLTAGSVDDFQEAFDREQVAVDPALVALAEDTTKEGQTVIFGPDVRVDAVNVRDVVETGNLNNVSYVFSPTSSTAESQTTFWATFRPSEAGTLTGDGERQPGGRSERLCG